MCSFNRINSCQSQLWEIHKMYKEKYTRFLKQNTWKNPQAGTCLWVRLDQFTLLWIESFSTVETKFLAEYHLSDLYYPFFFIQESF